MNKKILGEELPHTDAVQRVQESWEEFKEKAHPEFEKSVAAIAQGRRLVVKRSKHIFDRAVYYYRGYRGLFWAGAGLLALAVALTARPSKKG